jgi:glycosyltransferase involved in cell wall biosynthesis
MFMKILQIANGDFFSTYGGGQVYVKNLVDEMIRERLDVAVLSFVSGHEDRDVEALDYRGAAVYQVFRKTEKEMEKEIEHVIRQVDPAVIHVHAEKALVTGIAERLSLPCVVTAHHGGIVCPAGALMNHKNEICRVAVSHENCMKCVLRNTRTGVYFYPLLKMIPLSVRLKMGNLLSKLPFIYFVTPIGSTSRYIERKREEWRSIIMNTTVMIAPSNAIADGMIRNGLPAEKIRVIPHGIAGGGERSGVQRRRDRVKFFYVGRIGLIKGIHHLLSAVSQLDPSACELHVIGDVSGRDEKKMTGKYREKDNIVFHGKIRPEDVPSLIRGLDILVHPTICLEVFGLNIGEALSADKPVIATRCGGAEMQIRHGENGLLITPNDAGELREAMQWMLNRPEEVKRMSERAADHVAGMDDHVKELVCLYKKMIGDESGK